MSSIEYSLLEVIKNSKKPMIVAGGGVIYSGAEDELKALVETREP